MNRETVTILLTKNYVDQFQDIFRLYRYHRTKVCAGSGIGYDRLTTIVNFPAKATLEEIELLALHFEVERALILHVMDQQRLKSCKKIIYVSITAFQSYID